MSENPTSVLLSLQTAKSLRAFAPLVSFTPSGLAYTLYKIPLADRYRAFTIPKKSGGERTISAPTPHLRLLQSNLATLLTQCYEEINTTTQTSRTVCHGFRPKHSILTNARAHRNKRYVLNLDLEDFFGSINFGRIRGFFIHDRRFSLDPAVATIIAQIACHDNALPQGAPTSPVISNLIGQILDTRLTRLAKRHGCHYTRYVDDLTFSTRERHFPSALCVQRADRRNNWELGDRLIDCIERTGFSINHSKTRMQVVGSRQETTGLIVNEKVNIRPEYYRTVRSMCHSLFHTGSYFIPNLPSSDDEEPTQISHLAPLEGRLSFIYYVKDRRDLDSKAKEKAKIDRPVGFEKLYKRFLVYKFFVSSDLPVLVTEGKTDIVYLSCAMRSLEKDYPLLVMNEDGRVEKLVRFIHPTFVNQRVLKLGDGYTGINEFINRYARMMSGYHLSLPRSPVIIVVDNDSGGKAVFNTIESSRNIRITFGSKDPFFHLGANLYLVKTPSRETEMSCMEDLFSKDVLSVELNGKPFDKNKKHGDHSAYGKSEFADRVVRPRQDQIDFAQFAPILNGISSAILHYGKQLAELDDNEQRNAG